MNERNPYVFVTQELPVNYYEAEKYGEVMFLCAKEPVQQSNSLWNAELLRSMKETMKDYKPGFDYLCPSGSPIAIGLGFLVASWKGPKVRILHWHSATRRYQEYTIDLDSLIDRAFQQPQR